MGRQRGKRKVTRTHSYVSVVITKSTPAMLAVSVADAEISHRFVNFANATRR